MRRTGLTSTVCPALSAEAVAAFRETVWRFYKEHGRSLPWRETRDPYRVLVSEFMLQQTQVSRVLPKYLTFVERFPGISALAAAPLDRILVVWSGLGYNRRALWLKRIADTTAREGAGRLPRTLAGLRALPGVGPATAAAVAAFAYGEAHPFVETNIRTVIAHHFSCAADGGDAMLPEKDIAALVEATLDRDDPRNWYYALMDYGSALKRQGIGGGGRSPGRREPYAGSRRALRSAVLRVLLETSGATRTEVVISLGASGTNPGESSVNGEDTRLDEVLAALVAEGFLVLEGGLYHVRSG